MGTLETLTTHGVCSINHIPKRCRNGRSIIVRVELHVDVLHLTNDEAPVSFIVNEDNESDSAQDASTLRYFDNTNWSPVFSSHCKNGHVLTIAELKADLNSDCRKYHTLTFHSQCPMDYAKTPFKFPTIAELQGQGAQITDATCVVKLQHEAGQTRLIAVDGTLWAPANEPCYQVMTFGLPNNHGGTALVVSSIPPNHQGIFDTCYFPANALDDAIKYCERVATNRRDTKSLPIKPHTMINVYLDEAVSVRNPAEGHGLDTNNISVEKLCSKLNQIAHEPLNSDDLFITFLVKHDLEKEFRMYVSDLIDDQYKRFFETS